MLGFLSEYYSEGHLHVMMQYGLNMHRVATFIAATLIMGGDIADVTLQVAETIDIMQCDHESTPVIHGFAYGAEWNSTDPPMYEQVPNYVPDHYANKMDDEVDNEVASGRYVPVNRDTVIGIAAVGIVDKEKSGMVKVRIVHDLSRPLGSSVNTYTYTHLQTKLFHSKTGM